MEHVVLHRDEFVQPSVRFDEDHGHNEILQRTLFTEDHTIEARMSSVESIISHQNKTNKMTFDDDPASNTQLRSTTDYPMMIKFIQDAMKDIYHWQSLFCKKTAHLQTIRMKFRQ